MSKTSFTLAPELKRDCIELADWPLCKVLLLNDSQYPWFVLVPRIAGLKEIICVNVLRLLMFQCHSKAHRLR